MDGVTVTLVTNKQCEIKRFINKYFDTNSDISDMAFRWSSIYPNIIDSIGIVSALLDNDDDYLIEVIITFSNGVMIKLTKENLDTYIRYAINKRAIN